jgi:hypothetical protein
LSLAVFRKLMTPAEAGAAWPSAALTPDSTVESSAACYQRNRTPARARSNARAS